VGYDIVKKEHMIRKRILPLNTVFSVEQSAIIGLIITHSLSMIQEQWINGKEDGKDN
jgi:hypothetical protein